MAEVEDVLTELKVINSVLKNQDKQMLYASSVDDLFTGYADVWGYIKEYTENYGEMPSFELMVDRYSGDVEDVHVTGPTSHYVDTLRKEFIENRVEGLLTRASKEMAMGASADEVKNKIQQAFGKLDRFSSTSRDLDVMDMDSAKRRYDEVRARTLQNGGVSGVPVGIPFIDASMPLGLNAGDVMSIIGYPARGKSALGTLISAQAIMKGYKPLIFTREMSAEAVQDRIFTVMGSGLFSNTDLMMGNVNSDDFRSFADSVKGSAKIIDGNSSGEMTPNFMSGKIDEHAPDFVVLDYLQLFSDNRLSESMIDRMRNLSLEIKSLSNRKAIPIVVISSATPPDGGKIDGPPNVERSAYSRQLSYDSTVCLAVHKHDGTNLFQVESAKNRYGPAFSGYLDWDIDRGTYQERFDI